MKQLFIAGFTLILLGTALFKGLDLRPKRPPVELLLLHYSDNPQMNAEAHRLFKLNWYYGDKGLLLLRYHPGDQTEQGKKNAKRLRELRLMPLIQQQKLKKGELLLIDCQPNKEVIKTLKPKLSLEDLKKNIQNALTLPSKKHSTSQKNLKK